jgi:hypothetical protein
MKTSLTSSITSVNVATTPVTLEEQHKDQSTALDTFQSLIDAVFFAGIVVLQQSIPKQDYVWLPCPRYELILAYNVNILYINDAQFAQSTLDMNAADGLAS